MKKNVSVGITMLMLACTFSQAQTSRDPELSYVFSPDSLAGFDETAARESAISEGFVGKEFPVRMYTLKRMFIDEKYGLLKNRQHHFATADRGAVVPACTNEDFEEATASETITVSNQINGWTVVRGENKYPSNSCNLEGCCVQQPTASAVIYAPNGYIDPEIGPCYPIYSVFGDGPANSNANAANPQIPFPMRGNSFIRINNNQNDYSMERLSKTFAVTSSNALFQFAFINVAYPGHGCCDAGAFKIDLPGFSCPTFSASAPSSACPSNLDWLVASSCTAMPTNYFQPVFTKWQISSMDLTAYIGQTITIDIVASDCTAGGHWSYVYFDAQCGPMSILGNGVSFPAGSEQVVIPTCGPNGATICATPGLGPYSWAGPNIPQSMATPAYSNQCFTTAISAQYTLYMNPPGGCAPFTRIVQTTITAAPSLIGNVTQATCGGTLATISVTPGGSAGNPKFIEWFPPYYSINSQSTIATYTIPSTGSPTQIVTISASDQVGCPVSLTLGVNPPAPIPTFTVMNLSGTTTLTCANPTINLDIATTYSYGPANYFWASNSFTSSQKSIPITMPGTYTVSLTDAISLCSQSYTVNIGSDVQVPLSTISPTFQNITCTSTPITVTLTATNPTVNVSQEIVSQLGGTLSVGGPYTLFVPGTTGTFTHYVINNVNGCRTAKTFTVASSQGFPTFSLTSPHNFTLGCNSRSVITLNVENAQAVPGQGGAVSYKLLNPSGNPVSSNTTQSTYTNITVPGTYTVITQNIANGCETRLPVSVLSNTVPPGIDSVLVPTHILTCYTPSIELRGLSFSPNVNYNWKLPQNQNLAGDLLPVNADFTKPTTTTVATYTLEVEDNSSTCKSTTVVTISQNLFPPRAGASSQLSITCSNPRVVITNNSIPDPANPFPHPAPAIAQLWTGPSPQIPLQNSTTYTAYVPGTYTVEALDLNNGCSSTTTHVVPEDRDFPLLTPIHTVIECGAPSQSITASVIVKSGNEGKLRYQWETPLVTSDKTQKVLVVQQTGTYVLAVTNTVNGCGDETQVIVRADSLFAKIEPDKVTGFAPLTVNLHNLSTTKTGTDNITSVWMFGNNTTASLASVSSTNVTYTQPGTYTVVLYARKGSCLESDSKVIVVDVPSQMVIPNVFTPNGDGVNDLFFLQRTSNLAEIHATIFDRWGNKVYEVSSSTGQIEWDGNTMTGKPAATGTYFYIITAKGKDDKKYDEKGTISLIR